MKLFILAAASLLTFGCIASNDNDTSAPSKLDTVTVKPNEGKLIGYSVESCPVFAKPCGLDAPNDKLSAWVLRKPDTQLNTINPLDIVYIYISVDLINKGAIGPRTSNALNSGTEAIIDMGSQCLSFRQPGIDTIMIDKMEYIVQVPVEKCVPYTTNIK